MSSIARLSKGYPFEGYYGVLSFVNLRGGLTPSGWCLPNRLVFIFGIGRGVAFYPGGIRSYIHDSYLEARCGNIIN